MRIIKFLSCFIIIVVISGCQPRISKEKAFPDMYAEHPKSILVLPPMNATTAADAKEFYSTTVAEPLTACGYYVYPMEVVNDILQREGMYDTEITRNVPPQKFKEFFGADAIMLIRLLKWDTSYYVVGGHVTVSLEAELKSTVTGKQLWYYNGEIQVNTSGDSGGMSGLAGLLVAVATTAIKTAGTDYVPLAKKTNEEVLRSLPFGEYHSWYQKDQKTNIIDKSQQAPKQ